MGDHYKKCSAFALLFILIVLIYSNSFHASWHFDDFSNIVGIPNIQIEDVFPETLYGTFFDGPRLYRPIPRLTFAINWYLGKGDVFGFHLVNVFIHIVTAFFLYITLRHLMNTPNLRNKYDEDAQFFIALLSTTFWAVHPIHTQAVTYIVQRMASMSAMFYVGGMLFYLKARDRRYGSAKQLFLFFSCFISFILAFFSKENAVMMPLSLVLVEVVFYRDFTIDSLDKKMLLRASAVGGALFLLIFLFFVATVGNPLAYLARGYDIRPFSLEERLLTEPRVLFLYLGQLFYPIPEKFSFLHYVEISRSLVHPWSTLPAIAGISALFFFSLFQTRKRPLLAFSILFFLLNHVSESTFIPLELVYEHRNYLPILFLFLPISSRLWLVVNHFFKQGKKLLEYTIIASVVVFIMCLGLGTYTRNMVWLNEKVFWEDVIEKAPQFARGYQNLATSYYVKIQDYDTALALYETALSRYDPKPFASTLASLSNMMKAYFHLQNYQECISTAKRMINLIKNHNKGQSYRTFRDAASRYLVYAYIKMEKWPKASEAVDILLADMPHHWEFLFQKGFLSLQGEEPDYENAIMYLNRANKEIAKIRGQEELIQKKGEILFYLGVAQNELGRPEVAYDLLRRSLSLSPGDLKRLVMIIDNRIRVADEERTKDYVNILLSRFSLKHILTFLKDNNLSGIDYSEGMILNALENSIRRDFIFLNDRTGTR